MKTIEIKAGKIVAPPPRSCLISAFQAVYGSLFHITRHSERSGATHVDTLDLPSTRHPERSEESFNEILRLKPQDDVYHPTPSTFDNNRRAAFTLAEVLITLGIIGVVAALTIPTLISNYQQFVLNVQFKKTYSLITQTVDNVNLDFGYLPQCYYSNNNMSNAVSNECEKFYESFFNKLKVVQYCENKAYEKNCIPKYKGYDTVANENNPDAEVPEGYESYGDYASKGCTGFREEYILNSSKVFVVSSGEIFIPYTVPHWMAPILAVDINGKKGPNKWGYDIFTFARISDGNKVWYGPSACMAIEKGGNSTETMLKKLQENKL